MAEPIEIIIRQGGQDGIGFGSGTGGVVAGSKSSSRGIGLFKEGKNLQDKIGDKATKSAVGLGVGLAKKAVSYSLTNYGNMTGDYIGQQNINEALSVVGDIMSIAETGVGTYLFTGSIGLTAVAVGVAVGQKVGNIVNQYRSFDLSVKKQNIQAEFMRERAYGTLSSGSRGTNE